jgi:hypothetical protein
MNGAAGGRASGLVNARPVGKTKIEPFSYAKTGHRLEVGHRLHALLRLAGLLVRPRKARLWHAR